MMKIPSFKECEPIFIVLAMIVLFFMPIYPDEQAIQLIVFRGLSDGVNYNNLAYFCKSFNVEIPYFQYPIRYLINILFGTFSSPIYYRVFSISIFIVIYIIISNLLGNKLKYIIFLGYIPFSLVMLRPEALILMLVLSSIYIERRQLKYSTYYQFAIFSTLLILHPRTVFLFPLYAFFISCSTAKVYIRFTLIIIALFFEYQTIQMYSIAFTCPENQHMQGIFNSLRSIDPSLDLYTNIKGIIYKLKDINLVINSVFLYRIEGSFPVPVDFVDFWLYKYFSGYVAFVTTLLSIVTIVSFLFKRSDIKSLLRNFLILIFVVSCFLFQKDRFYEAAVLLPLIIVIYSDINGKFSLLNSGLKVSGIISILLIIFAIGPKFISKWGPYSQIRPLDSSLQLEIDKNFSFTSKYVLVDFDTFNYLKNTKNPIMINFFYWYTDGLNNGLTGDLSRLKFLYDIGSDGIAARCDRIPEHLNSLSRKVTVNKFSLCYINRDDLSKLFD